MAGSQSAVSVAALETLLCAAVAQACSRGPSHVLPSSRMLDLNMDSLTFVSVLAQVEAVYEFELTSGDTLALLAAPDVGALARELRTAIARHRVRPGDDRAVPAALPGGPA